MFTDCFCSYSQHRNVFTDISGENRQVQLHWSSKRYRAKFQNQVHLGICLGLPMGAIAGRQLPTIS